MRYERQQPRPGLTRQITRRDFLNGVALTVGGAIASQTGLLAALDANSSANYPPALTGLRGSYDATYQYAHMLRDDKFWART